MNYVMLVLGLVKMIEDLTLIQKKAEEGQSLTQEDRDTIALAEQMEMLRLGRNTGHEGEV